MIHSHSVYPLQEVVSPALARLLAGAPLSAGKLRFAWRLAVGAAIDRMTTPTLCDGGRVEVSVADDRWQAELRRTLPLIRGRLDALLGTGVITNVVVQCAEPAGGIGQKTPRRVEDRRARLEPAAGTTGPGGRKSGGRSQPVGAGKRLREGGGAKQE